MILIFWAKVALCSMPADGASRQANGHAGQPGAFHRCCDQGGHELEEPVVFILWAMPVRKPLITHD